MIADRIGAAQLPRHRRKAGLNGVVIVDDDVGWAHDIEGDDESTKQRTYLCGEERQDGQHSGGEVTVGGEGGEPDGQSRPYDSRKDKDEPEESKTVQCSDCTLRRESIHNLEPGPNVDAEAKQPRDVTENELNSEESFC